MKVGDRVRCTFSIDEIYTVGLLYPILDFDTGSDPIIADNDGDGCIVGQPLDGVFWKFEVVDEQEQTDALIKLVEISQAELEAGKGMTPEQVMERLTQERSKKQ